MIAFFAAIPAFIQSLPYLFQLGLKFMQSTEKFVAWSKENKLLERYEETEKAIDLLEKAKTVEDKRKANDALRDGIAKL